MTAVEEWGRRAAATADGFEADAVRERRYDSASSASSSCEAFA